MSELVDDEGARTIRNKAASDFFGWCYSRRRRAALLVTADADAATCKPCLRELEEREQRAERDDRTKRYGFSAERDRAWLGCCRRYGIAHPSGDRYGELLIEQARLALRDSKLHHLELARTVTSSAWCVGARTSARRSRHLVL